MILYDPNKWMGFHKLVQLEGSVTMTVLPHCLLAALLAILVNQQDLIFFPSKAYGHQIFTYGLSFLVIMRTNLSYSRYWEGITACILMHSKWLDAAAQIIAFDELSKGAAAASGPKFRAHVVHIFGLMSATAMLELQGEDESELRNLVREYFPPDDEPPDAPFQSHDVRPASAASPASVVPLSDQQPKLSRSKSNLEGNLEESGTDAAFLPVIGKVTEGEYTEYHSAKDAEVPVHYWMQKMVRLITKRHHQGGLAAPPPIVSRIFQELSNGLLGFENAHKITAIPFPFPYTQIVQYLQTAFVVSVPFVVCSFVDDLAFQMVFSFLAVFTFTSLNAVASELEDPFGHDANDLPLRQLHGAFVMKMSQLFFSCLSEADRECLLLEDDEPSAAATPSKAADATDKAIEQGVAGLMSRMNQQVLGSNGTVTHEEALRAVFNSVDNNKNGVLEHSECRELCSRIGLNFSDEKAQYMIRKIDPEDTGRVDFESFWNWFLKKHRRMLKKQSQMTQ